MSSPDAALFRQAASRIESWTHPLLITHARPDGDALGSLVAMRALLGARHIDALALLYDAIPERYAIFRGYAPMPVWKVNISDSNLENVDGVIVLDTCTYSQLDPIADWLRNCDLPKVAVDHHVTRDDLADLLIVDESAAATCLILHDWARVMGWPMNPELAEALFIGMAMDTGWFRHANTDGRVLTAVADLVAGGVRLHELYQTLFQRESPARVRLLGAALNTMELVAQEQAAVMTLSSDTMTRVGATASDTEDIVNEPLRINSVRVSVLLVEQSDGVIRASFRSKPPAATVASHEGTVPTKSTVITVGQARDVNVATLAEVFGGGGHKRAAGARLVDSLAGARKKIIDSLTTVLSG